MKMLKAMKSKIGFGMILAIFSSALFAFTAPAATDIGYQIWDVVMNQVLNGPIGITAAVLAFLVGVVQLFRSWVMGVVGIIVASLIFNANAIVSTLGMTF